MVGVVDELLCDKGRWVGGGEGVSEEHGGEGEEHERWEDQELGFWREQDGVEQEGSFGGNMMVLSRKDQQRVEGGFIYFDKLKMDWIHNLFVLVLEL